jgi:hypothetical protein
LKHGIEFTVIWADQDVSELQVKCSNGYFSGTVDIYIGHDALTTMADTLSGFPSHPTDSRNFELGTFDPKYADGGLRLHLFCRDSVGHGAADIKLRGGGCMAMGEVASVALRIPIEAAAVDRFLLQLREMNTNDIGATAHLEMAGPV